MPTPYSYQELTDHETLHNFSPTRSFVGPFINFMSNPSGLKVFIHNPDGAMASVRIPAEHIDKVLDDMKRHQHLIKAKE